MSSAWGGIGVAILKRTTLEKNIVNNESNDVIEFFDDNTKTNVHGGLSESLDWLFSICRRKSWPGQMRSIVEGGVKVDSCATVLLDKARE